jgi:DNA-binding GntR family transcriptional regulator
MPLNAGTAANSAYAEAYEFLRDSIRDGRIQSGARIKAEDIAAQLGISRMPVREAIRQLDSEGLVTIRTNRGAVVTVLNADQVLELFQMRSVLEGLAVRRAIENFDDDAFEELTVRLTRLDRAKANFHEWIARHNEFHDYICALSKAQRLFTDVQRLRTAVEPYLRMVLGPMSGGAIAEHRRIIDVIRQGDPAVAEEVMREHVLETAYDLIRLMSLSGETSEPR